MYKSLYKCVHFKWSTTKRRTRHKQTALYIIKCLIYFSVSAPCWCTILIVSACVWMCKSNPAPPNIIYVYFINGIDYTTGAVLPNPCAEKKNFLFLLIRSVRNLKKLNSLKKNIGEHCNGWLGLVCAVWNIYFDVLPQI